MPVRQVVGGAVRDTTDAVAVEEPLEIQVGGRTIAVTMRTPGHDDELAVGFLFAEGVLAGAGDLRAVRRPREGVVDIALAAGVAVDWERLARHVYTASSCGVCGRTSIEAVRVQTRFPAKKGRPTVAPATVHALPGRLRAAQDVFERTGGLHAAALFSADGTLQALREDVGRHNALDKLIGRAALDGALPLDEAVALVSGRASFELVQKAVVAGIPLLAAVGAPSSLAVELAREFDTTLLGFVRDGRFNVYAGEWRIEALDGHNGGGASP